jgi:hypothetical protein
MRGRPRRVAQVSGDFSYDRDRVAVVFRQVIGNAAHARMHFAAAERLDVYFFLGGGVHELRSAEEHRALITHDDGLVA